MSNSDFSFFVGVDWGSEQHQIHVMDAAGDVHGQWSVPHRGASIQQLCQRLVELAPQAQVAVAIESPSSPVTEPLLQSGVAVFSINPKQLDRFRDRFFPAGAKDDRRDSFVLAASLRTDRDCFRRLDLQDPVLVDLRSLVRLEQTLKADLRAYCNRLREALLLSFPAILELNVAVDEPWIWNLLEMAPSAPIAARLSLARLRSLLRRHRIRRITPEDLYQRLRQPALPLSQDVFQNSARQVRRLLPMVRLLADQLRDNTADVQAALDSLTTVEETEGQHRDVAILLSLPGVGTNVAATMLAEAAGPLHDRDYHALRALAGVAPITRQSGKSRQVIMRRACCHALREALYHWSRPRSLVQGVLRPFEGPWSQPWPRFA